jgi:hypothetical protein
MNRLLVLLAQWLILEKQTTQNLCHQSLLNCHTNLRFPNQELQPIHQ